MHFEDSIGNLQSVRSTQFNKYTFFLHFQNFYALESPFRQTIVSCNRHMHTLMLDFLSRLHAPFCFSSKINHIPFYRMQKGISYTACKIGKTHENKCFVCGTLIAFLGIQKGRRLPCKRLSNTIEIKLHPESSICMQRRSCWPYTAGRTCCKIK
jgi:hypothetical protein